MSAEKPSGETIEIVITRVEDIVSGVDPELDARLARADREVVEGNAHRSLDVTPEELAEIRRKDIAVGEADIAAGRVVPHEEVLAMTGPDGLIDPSLASETWQRYLALVPDLDDALTTAWQDHDAGKGRELPPQQ